MMRNIRDVQTVDTWSIHAKDGTDTEMKNKRVVFRTNRPGYRVTSAAVRRICLSSSGGVCAAAQKRL